MVSGSALLTVALADTSTVHVPESGIAVWQFLRLAFSIDMLKPAVAAWRACNTFSILELGVIRAPRADVGNTVPFFIKHCRRLTRRTPLRNAFGTVKMVTIVTFGLRVGHTVLIMLHPVLTDRNFVHHTFIAIPMATAHACRRNVADTQVVFQSGVWRALGIIASKAIVAVLDSSIRAYRGHLVDTVAVRQGRVVFALRFRPPNTFTVCQGVLLGTFRLGRVVDITPTIEGRLAVRAFSVNRL